jgi:hypothetical protein
MWLFICWISHSILFQCLCLLRAENVFLRSIFFSSSTNRKFFCCICGGSGGKILFNSQDHTRSMKRSISATFHWWLFLPSSENLEFHHFCIRIRENVSGYGKWKHWADFLTKIHEKKFRADSRLLVLNTRLFENRQKILFIDSLIKGTRRSGCWDFFNFKGTFTELILNTEWEQAICWINSSLRI